MPVRANAYKKRSNPRDVTDKQREFLNAFEIVGTITAAAREANIDRKTHYWQLGNKRDGTPRDKRYKARVR